MLGVVVGTCTFTSGYAGQYATGYVVHNSDGNLYYGGKKLQIFFLLFHKKIIQIGSNVHKGIVFVWFFFFFF